MNEYTSQSLAEESLYEDFETAGSRIGKELVIKEAKQKEYYRAAEAMERALVAEDEKLEDIKNDLV